MQIISFSSLTSGIKGKGQNITAQITYTGSCSAANLIQLDLFTATINPATNLPECTIQNSGVNMPGLTKTSASFPTIDGVYRYNVTLPAVPDVCAGKFLKNVTVALFNNSMSNRISSNYFSKQVTGIILNQCLNYNAWESYATFQVTKEGKTKYFATCSNNVIHPAIIYSMNTTCGTYGAKCYCDGTCVGTENNCGNLPDNTYCTNCETSQGWVQGNCEQLVPSSIQEHKFTNEESFDAKPLNHLEMFDDTCTCNGVNAVCSAPGIVNVNNCPTGGGCTCYCPQHLVTYYTCLSSASICSSGCLANPIYGVKLYNQSSYVYNLFKCNSTYEDGICPDHFSNPDGTGLNICSSNGILDYDCLPRVEMRCGDIFAGGSVLTEKTCVDPAPVTAKNCPSATDCVYKNSATETAACYAYDRFNPIQIQNADGKTIECDLNNEWCPKDFDYINLPTRNRCEIATLTCDEGNLGQTTYSCGNLFNANGGLNPQSFSNCLMQTLDPTTRGQRPYSYYCGLDQQWDNYQVYALKPITVK